MRVLQVITGLAPGGAELQLALLLRHLPERCDVVCLTNPGKVADQIRADGFRVTSLRMRSNRDLSAVGRLAAIIREGEYDLVHTHLYRAGLYGRLAARMAGVRTVVATEHSLGRTVIEGRRKDSPGIRGAYRAAERLGRVTIAVSPAVAAYLRQWGIDSGRIAIIPNGIDVGAFRYDGGLRDVSRKALGIRPGTLVVGGVGRLDPMKRFDVLIDAVARIDGAVLLLVGGGPERARLEQLARERLPGRAFLTGERGGGVAGGDGAERVRELLCAMDVFASPSPEETFGLAVLEATACGLPVVYSDSPALDGLPGLGCRVTRVPSRAEAFRAAIEAVSDRGAPDRSGVPESLSCYGIANQAVRVAELYHRVLEAGSAAPGPSDP